MAIIFQARMWTIALQPQETGGLMPILPMRKLGFGELEPFVYRHLACRAEPGIWPPSCLIPKLGSSLCTAEWALKLTQQSTVGQKTGQLETLDLVQHWWHTARSRSALRNKAPLMASLTLHRFMPIPPSSSGAFLLGVLPESTTGSSFSEVLSSLSLKAEASTLGEAGRDV